MALVPPPPGAVVGLFLWRRLDVPPARMIGGTNGVGGSGVGGAYGGGAGAGSSVQAEAAVRRRARAVALSSTDEVGVRVSKYATRPAGSRVRAVCAAHLMSSCAVWRSKASSATRRLRYKAQWSRGRRL